MTITPTKKSQTKPVFGIIGQVNVRIHLERISHVWNQPESTEFEVLVATEMSSMVALTNGASLEIKDPDNTYPGMLKPTLARLRALDTQPDDNIPPIRASILGALRTDYPNVTRAEDQLEWGRVPQFVDHPDDTTINQNAAARALCVWPDNQHGQTLDRFNNLCLGLWYCNARLGLNPASTEEYVNDRPLLEPTAHIRAKEYRR